MRALRPCASYKRCKSALRKKNLSHLANWQARHGPRVCVCGYWPREQMGSPTLLCSALNTHIGLRRRMNACVCVCVCQQPSDTSYDWTTPPTCTSTLPTALYMRMWQMECNSANRLNYGDGFWMHLIIRRVKGKSNPAGMMLFIKGGASFIPFLDTLLDLCTYLYCICRRLILTHLVKTSNWSSFILAFVSSGKTCVRLFIDGFSGGWSAGRTPRPSSNYQWPQLTTAVIKGH